MNKPKHVLKRQALSEVSARQAKKARIAPAPQRKGKASSTVAVRSPSLKVQGKQKQTKVPFGTPEDADKGIRPQARPKVARTAWDLGPSALPSAFKIVAGSYEKLLYGLQGSVALSLPSKDDTAGPSPGEGIAFRLEPQFIFPAHVSCVKAVTASPGGGKWLATGSADEIIKVWDLRRRKEIGGLMHHTGSLTHLSFPSRTHLLSASEDGTLALFHARDWSVLRALRGHKGRVNGVAVHPSGKLALSVGRDRTLRMWDLMRGKSSASIKLYKEGEAVRWNSSGSMFVVAAQSTLDIYSTDMTLLHAITHPSRTHDVLFIEHPHNPTSPVLLVAAENGKVSAYSVPMATPSTSSAPEDASSDEGPTRGPVPRIYAEFVGHANRVKAISTLTLALPTSPTQPRTSTTIMSTISSDGKIFVYDLYALPSLPAQGHAAPARVVPQLEPDAVYDTAGTRLTCVVLAQDEVPATSAADKKQTDQDGQEGAESSDDDGPEWEAQVEGEEEDKSDSHAEGGEDD